MIWQGAGALREGYPLGKRSVAVGFGFAFAAVAALAQTSAPPSDRAAMERALQQADGPKRRILEAARLKAGTPPPTPAPTPAPTPVAAAPALPNPAPARAEAPVAPPSQAPESEIVVVITMPSGIEPVAVPAPARVGSVAAVAPLEAAPPRPRLLDLPPAPPPAAALPAPRLLSMAEPELPARVFRRAGGRVELLVDVVIDTDGSVKSAAVRTSSHADADEPVLDAVRLWRYEPQPAVRPHQVRLVVSPP